MAFSIGKYRIDPPYLLAPMASVSEMPFRVIALEMGAGLATTELISANGIFYKNRRTRQYMTFDRDRERPYSIQLFGGEAGVMAHAAGVAAEHGADIIDINMGCPVKKVTKTGAGSALMCDVPRAADLVVAMRKATDDRIPITVKIRTGWDDASINCVEMAKAFEGAGCAGLAIHGRTRAQGYAGHADWSQIRRCKEGVTTMPIIGNGDVNTPADARRMFAETNCDGVMIGRGALGNPWIFTSLRGGNDATPTPADRLALIKRHLKAHVAFHISLDDEEARKHLRVPPDHMAVRTFRQHLVWYSRGLQGGSAFRKEVMTHESPDAVFECLERFFGEAQNAIVDVGAEEAEDVNYNAAFG